MANSFSTQIREKIGLDNNNVPICTFSAFPTNDIAGQLAEKSMHRREGGLSADGALMFGTGFYTGRSASSKYVVDHSGIHDIDFGEINQPISPKHFESFWKRAAEYVNGRGDVQRSMIAQQLYVCADPQFTIPLHVVTETAWHSLFSRYMFLRRVPEGMDNGKAPLTVFHVPGFNAEMPLKGELDPRFIGVDLKGARILVGGTGYAGELKKSVFTFLNYILTDQGVLPLHCSANLGLDRRDVALYLGLSGTGKTTLSTDVSRGLIGDDEHGWGENGIFNFEGGCSAKVYKITPETEPQIYAAARNEGTILENVACREGTNVPDFFNDKIAQGIVTQNGRASYPIDFIPNSVSSGRGEHPKNIFLLACDAFGVLPPISRLTPEQAAFQFLSGYTAKVAGAELGSKAGEGPQATFSACFGAPFLPRPPSVYADMFMRMIERHSPHCWLVNTGYTGTGKRMPIDLTRRFVNAALSGELDRVSFLVNNPFGLSVPVAIEGVDPRALDIQQTWVSTAAYKGKVSELAKLFADNFGRFEHKASTAVVRAARQFSRACELG